MKFDHTKFFDAYRGHFGAIKAQSQAEGIEGLLTSLEADPDVSDVRWAAYMFATVKHECADTWHPIEEYGRGNGKPYGVPVNVTGSDGTVRACTYYGRGYVQLTWQTNYQKIGEAIGQGNALVSQPELALSPPIAYHVISYGMRKGIFTGNK